MKNLRGILFYYPDFMYTSLGGGGSGKRKQPAAKDGRMPLRIVYYYDEPEASGYRERKGKTMLKAVFMDYTGTMVQEDEPYTRELLAYFISHSRIKDPQEILKVVWGKVKEIEAECYGERFVGNDERADRILAYCRENCGLDGDMDHMHEVWRKIWVQAPLFDDVKPFFEKSSLPVYVLSNDDLCYLEESMRLKDLHPAGIVSAELAKACKPHPAIFEKAMEIAGVTAEEVIHIGDSVTSDVEPAKRLGIRPVYLSRGRDTVIEGVRVIRSLNDFRPEDQ